MQRPNFKWTDQLRGHPAGGEVGHQPTISLTHQRDDRQVRQPGVQKVDDRKTIVLPHFQIDAHGLKLVCIENLGHGGARDNARV